jgi:hypothetical protein
VTRASDPRTSDRFPECDAKRTPAEWYQIRGARVYNYALIDRVSDSEFELRIARAIEDAYAAGFRRGAQTLEERLGA